MQLHDELLSHRLETVVTLKQASSSPSELSFELRGRNVVLLYAGEFGELDGDENLIAERAGIESAFAREVIHKLHLSHAAERYLSCIYIPVAPFPVAPSEKIRR